jgi:tryptophan synthase beta chain
MEPDADGYFGAYGGVWVAESLVEPVARVERAFAAARKDPAFLERLARFNRTYGGRPTPLYHAERLSAHAGAAIHLKREDLVHGGAHKFNNVMGQALLAQKMGARRIIAETGAGQHGVATAMAGAVLGIPVEVYMGAVDVARQAPNVERMRLLGATVHPVTSGARTLKDAVNEALRAWSGDPEGTYYCIGSAVGPHPYPLMVREFQRVIGTEARAQFQAETKRDHPDAVVACVGGGSNAIGTFTAFLDDPVKLVGVEAAGDGLDTPRHAATLSKGRAGILHGARSVLLQDADGQVIEAHSISAGLDYPGVGPEHAFLRDAGRVTYASATDTQALTAARLLARLEGILPALESSHAIAHALVLAKELGRDAHLVVTLSGRGDKDLATLSEVAP